MTVAMSSPGSTTTHEPGQFAIELAAQQASSERRLRVLIGAGASRAAGVPGLSDLGTRVLRKLEPIHGAPAADLFAGRNLEEALTRLRRIVSLLGPGEAFSGLGATEAGALESALTDAIVAEITAVVPAANPYDGLATWMVHQDRRHPVEAFTLNYDLLLENALEARAAAYFDGFVGSIEGAFRADLVDGGSTGSQLPPFVSRVWKLHGSINWKVTVTSGVRQVVRVGQAAAGNVAAIYPSEEKYEASRRTPFLVLHDRYRRALNEPESLLLVAGYSFGDQHLNEVIFDAALLNPRSQITVFCHRSIPDELAAKASALANLTVVSEMEAIWSGVRAPWAATDVDGVAKGGRLLLADFPNLAGFLGRSARGSIAP